MKYLVYSFCLSILFACSKENYRLQVSGRVYAKASAKGYSHVKVFTCPANFGDFTFPHANNFNQETINFETRTNQTGHYKIDVEVDRNLPYWVVIESSNLNRLSYSSTVHDLVYPNQPTVFNDELHLPGGMFYLRIDDTSSWFSNRISKIRFNSFVWYNKPHNFQLEGADLDTVIPIFTSIDEFQKFSIVVENSDTNFLVIDSVFTPKGDTAYYDLVI